MGIRSLDTLLIVLMSAVLIAMTYIFNKSAHNAEGRIHTLEIVVQDLCSKHYVPDCDIYSVDGDL